MLPTDTPPEPEQTPMPATRQGLGLRIALLCLVGGFLVFWPYCDDRSLWWYRCHLGVIDGQLRALKELLQDHKNQHGHYPTNEEGLAALDSFESRFTLTYYRNKTGASQLGSWGFPGEGVGHDWWLRSRHTMMEYRRKNGRLPQNAEEFIQAGLSSLPRERNPYTEALPTTIEIGIDRHCNVFLLNRSGVLCPWTLPYLYENREGYKADAFAGSLADGDRYGYCVQVDDNVYLFSSGGYEYARKLNWMWWGRFGPRFVGGLLVLIGVGSAIYGAVWGKQARVLWAIAAMIPGLLFGGFLVAAASATCYVMSQLFSRRTPEMASLQLKLLKKYRANGVISEETYRWAESAALGEILFPKDKAEKQQK